MLSNLESTPTWVRRGIDPNTSSPVARVVPRVAWASCVDTRRLRERGRYRASSKSAGFKYYGEYNFNLSEYVVVLDKPLGLTLAPDPATGRILVQQIHAGSPAAECKLIKVGDCLKSCSAVFGDDMWECTDLHRTIWAVNNRVGKVRLILERSEDPTLPLWYHLGKEGVVSFGVPLPPFPVKLGASSEEEILDEQCFGMGRVLQVGFHRSHQESTQAPMMSAGRRMRLMRMEQLRQELEEARLGQDVEISTPVARMMASKQEQLQQYRGGNPHVNGSTPHRRQGPAAAVAAAATAVASQAHNSLASSSKRMEQTVGDKKVVQVTPWLLVSLGRLLPQELVRIATGRALDSLLELNLRVKDSRLVTGLQQTPPATQEEGLIAAVACLHRLVIRRRFTRCKHGSCHVLLHCDSGLEGLAGLVVAGWLHWCCGLDEEEALTAAEIALGVELDEGLLLQSSQWLVDRAKQANTRVVLRWPYGGLRAEVSGEVVGGWTERVAMTAMPPQRGSSHAHFVLELSGMRPGRYHYKYIIDNTWAVDPFAPRDLDAVGNWNNVLEVFPPPKIHGAEEEQHFSTLQVLHAAFAAKMGCGSKAPPAAAPS